jgi:hypothetical protein
MDDLGTKVSKVRKSRKKTDNDDNRQTNSVDLMELETNTEQVGVKRKRRKEKNILSDDNYSDDRDDIGEPEYNGLIVSKNTTEIIVEPNEEIIDLSEQKVDDDRNTIIESNSSSNNKVKSIVVINKIEPPKLELKKKEIISIHEIQMVNSNDANESITGSHLKPFVHENVSRKIPMVEIYHKYDSDVGNELVLSERDGFNVFEINSLEIKYKKNKFTTIEIERATANIKPYAYCVKDDIHMLLNMLQHVKGKWMFNSVLLKFYDYTVKKVKRGAIVETLELLIWQIEESMYKKKKNSFENDTHNYRTKHGDKIGCFYYKDMGVDYTGKLQRIVTSSMNNITGFDDVGQLVVFVIWVSVYEPSIFNILCESLVDEFSAIILTEPIMYILDIVFLNTKQFCIYDVKFEDMNTNAFFKIKFGHYIKILTDVFELVSDKPVKKRKIEMNK